MALRHGTIPEWTLGERLRKARELAGIKQEEMAQEFGVSENTVSRWEHGVQPRHLRLVDVCRRWSELTGVSLVWLLTGQSTPAYNREGEIRDQRQGQLPFTSDAPEFSGVSHFPPPPAPIALRRVRVASTSA